MTNHFDLLSFPELYPKDVAEILESWNDESDLYQEGIRINSELNLIGWQIEYDLSGELFDLQKISTADEITQIRSICDWNNADADPFVQYHKGHHTIKMTGDLNASQIDQINELDFVKKMFWIDPDGEYALPFIPSNEMDLIFKGIFVII